MLEETWEQVDIALGNSQPHLFGVAAMMSLLLARTADCTSVSDMIDNVVLDLEKNKMNNAEELHVQPISQGWLAYQRLRKFLGGVRIFLGGPEVTKGQLARCTVAYCGADDRTVTAQKRIPVFREYLASGGNSVSLQTVLSGHYLVLLQNGTWKVGCMSFSSWANALASDLAIPTENAIDSEENEMQWYRIIRQFLTTSLHIGPPPAATGAMPSIDPSLLPPPSDDLVI